jgi:hypothetical protein
MRTLRAATVATLTGVLLLAPSSAGADGGAYIDLDRTHYLPGETAIGIGYVSIPESKQDLLERGPFYVYVVPEPAWIREGRPLPEHVIRVGTASIERDAGTAFEVRTTFTVPDVPGDYYTVQLCNDPCTISGFREPLTALISIVRTEREAELLNRVDQLERDVWGAQRKARKAQKLNTELQEELGASREHALELSAEVSRLEREVAGAPPAPAATTVEDRPLVDAWALFGLGVAVIVAVLAFGLALVLARRPVVPRLVVPDTIEELEREEEPAPIR